MEARALKREVEPKGQLILKCPFDVFKSPNESFVWISALASKKRSNQNIRGTLYHWLDDFILILLYYILFWLDFLL